MRWQPTGGRASSGGRGSVPLFVVAGVLFGTGFVGIEVGLAEFPPVLFAALRFDVAALALVPLALSRGRSAWKPASRGDWAAILVAAVFMFALNGALLFVGQLATTAGAAAVTYGLVPVAAPVFATRLLPAERLTPRGWVGVLVGLLGVVVVVNPSPAAFAAGAAGQLLVAGAATSVALGSVLLRRVDPGLGSVSVTAWGMVLGAAVLHPVSFALGESVGAVSPRSLWALAYVGVVATGAAFPAYFALIRRAGPLRANLLSYAIPLVTTAVAWGVLGERPAATTAVGFLLVVAGFALVEWRALRTLFGRSIRERG